MSDEDANPRTMAAFCMLMYRRTWKEMNAGQRAEANDIWFSGPTHVRAALDKRFNR